MDRITFLKLRENICFEKCLCVDKGLNALLTPLLSTAVSVIVNAIVFYPWIVMAFIIPLRPSLLLSCTLCWFPYLWHLSLLSAIMVPFKSILLCYFISHCDPFSNKVTECGEAQMVYIVNGKAAEFSEVNQNEENVLF